MRSLLWLLAGLLLVGAALTYARFGTVEPCGVLRQLHREADLRRGGLDAIAASQLPDSVYDHALALQIGPLTPGKCASALAGVVSGRELHGLNKAE